MHSIEFDKSIIKGVKLINVETIITHEEIIEQKAGLKNSRHIPRISIDPNNHDIVYASVFKSIYTLR